MAKLFSDPDNASPRPALYYPYIHIRSEHWLKATLLCTPAVKRIVPETYNPEDSKGIVKYTKIIGSNGALLQAVPAYSKAADQAQMRMLRQIKDHLKDIQDRYGRHKAPVPDEYWIHDAKFNEVLLHFLIDHNLAWSSADPHDRAAYGHRTWYALHPVLGSAVMTTLGLCFATILSALKNSTLPCHAGGPVQVSPSPSSAKNLSGRMPARYIYIYI
jgi:hypothetical protein